MSDKTDHERLWRSYKAENIKLHNENLALKEICLKMQEQIGSLAKKEEPKK